MEVQQVIERTRLLNRIGFSINEIEQAQAIILGEDWDADAFAAGLKIGVLIAENGMDGLSGLELTQEQIKAIESAFGMLNETEAANG